VFAYLASSWIVGSHAVFLRGNLIWRLDGWVGGWMDGDF